MIVKDPISAWGSTAAMGARELLEAVDRAEGPHISKAHRVVWERLGCRAQALLPDFTASELCRMLFGFHRSRCRDEALLEAACEAVLTEQPGKELLGNDIALLLKALSKHGYQHLPAIDFLLGCASEQLEHMTAADISQLIAAMLRLELSDRLQKYPHPDLLERLFESSRRKLDDAYLPPADLTNLCVAAAICSSTDHSARFLHDTIVRFDAEVIVARTPPRDVVRRLQSIRTFDKRLKEYGVMTIVPITQRLGVARLAAICRASSRSLAHRINEVDLETCVAACETMAQLLPHCDICAVRNSNAKSGKQRHDAGFWGDDEFGSVLSLVLQRLAGMSHPLLRRMHRAASTLDDVLNSKPGNQHERRQSHLCELLAALPHELQRRASSL